MRIIPAIGLALVLQGSVAWADPAAPTGLFEVIETHRDIAISNAAASEPENAPQTVNRIVAFEQGGATFDGDAVVCQKIESKTESLPVEGVLRKAFGERSIDQRENKRRTRYPGPSDFRLKMTAATKVPATRFRCLDNDKSEWTGRAIFPIGNGQWALTWNNDYLLILRPVAPDSPIRPSFDCSKATSPTERAICSDRNLAGWDRSISDAYSDHVKNGGDSEAVRTEQRGWLAERDACAADKACILDKMQLRALNLSKW